MSNFATPNSAANAGGGSSPGDAVVSASNLGDGQGVFAVKVGSDLQFYSIAAGANVTIELIDEVIVISSSGGGSEDAITAIENVGTGSAIYKALSGSTAQFKTITAGANITIDATGDTISITGAAPGEVNTGDNLGAGEGIFAGKTGTTLNFKTLVAGENIAIEQLGDTLVFSAPDSLPASGTSLGTGEDIYISTADNILAFRTLGAGDNISLTVVDDAIVISATDTGEVNTAANLGVGGQGIFASKSGTELQFYSLEAGDNITLDLVDNKIVITADAAAGETTTAANVGTGTGLFKVKDGTTLQFKSLLAGDNVTITQVGDDLVIAASTGTGGETNVGQNLGDGLALYAGKSGVNLQFYTLEAGSNVTIELVDNSYVISAADTGEVNTGANLGAGNGVYAGKVGSELQFKSLVAGSNISISNDGNTITITGSNPGEVNTAANLGTGSGLFANKTGAELRFYSIKAGTNVTISFADNSYTINATGEANTAANLGASGEGVFAGKSGTELQFKKLIAGTGITLTSDSNSITIAASGGGGGSYDAREVDLATLKDVSGGCRASSNILNKNGWALYARADAIAPSLTTTKVSPTSNATQIASSNIMEFLNCSGTAAGFSRNFTSTRSYGIGVVVMDSGSTATGSAFIGFDPKLFLGLDHLDETSPTYEEYVKDVEYAKAECSFSVPTLPSTAQNFSARLNFFADCTFSIGVELVGSVPKFVLRADNSIDAPSSYTFTMAPSTNANAIYHCVLEVSEYSSTQMQVIGRVYNANTGTFPSPSEESTPIILNKSGSTEYTPSMSVELKKSVGTTARTMEFSIASCYYKMKAA